jgi:hypothetical protein
MDARRFTDISKNTNIATIGKPFSEDTLLKLGKPSHEEMWSDPHQAYLALVDAIYRPRVTLAESMWNDHRYQKETNEHSANPFPIHTRKYPILTLKIHLPFFLPGKSKLHIILDEQREDYPGHYKSYPLESVNPKKIQNEPAGPVEYEKVYAIQRLEPVNFVVKVRLDLHGDNEVQLPHEPLLCKDDIETEIDKKTVKGIQMQTENKWIVVQTVARTITT